MEITYGNIKISDQYLTPEVTQIKPVVSLKGLDTNKMYTLIMSDPNAIGGNMIHWLVTNINGTNIETGNEILEYYGPHPPQGTGIHNYIFSLYESNKSNSSNKYERQIELAELLKELGITNNPIYTKKFTSHNIQGGKRKRNKSKRRSKKIRKNRKTKRRRY